MSNQDFHTIYCVTDAYGNVVAKTNKADVAMKIFYSMHINNRSIIINYDIFIERCMRSKTSYER